MLWPLARVAFSAVLVVLLGVSVWLIYKLANSSVTVSGASPSSREYCPNDGICSAYRHRSAQSHRSAGIGDGLQNVTIKSGASS